MQTSTQTSTPGTSAIAPTHAETLPQRTTTHDDGFVVQALGTLGLLEVWVFILFVLGAKVDYSNFEKFIFNVMGVFELLARVVGVMTLCLVLNSGGGTSSEKTKTLTRDQLHNMVYPRSPLRTRRRRDFAAMAWYSLFFSVIPVVLLLTFYPVWGSSFSDDPLWARAVPSVLAVLAILLSVAGSSQMASNRSCYALTVLYATAKIISFFLLVRGASRLLFGEEGEDGDGGGDGLAFLGVPLVFLQALKIGSACLAAIQYVNGRPDEELPEFADAAKLCHFCHA